MTHRTISLRTETLTAVVADYRDVMVARGLAANSQEAYGRDLTRYLAWATGRDLLLVDEVTSEDLTDFLADLIAGEAGGRPLSLSSAARTLAAVRGLHRFAAEVGLAREDPGRHVRGPAPRPVPVRTLTRQQVSALLQASGGDDPLGRRDRVLLHLLYASAARVGELVGLDVTDVDLATATIRLPDRGAGERLAELDGRTCTELVQYLDLSRPLLGDPGVPALVVNSRGGRLTRQAAWQILGTVADRAGLRGISPQDLRSSRAAHLLDERVPVARVQALLGHASATTTANYKRSRPSGRRSDLASVN